MTGLVVCVCVCVRLVFVCVFVCLCVCVSACASVSSVRDKNNIKTHIHACFALDVFQEIRSSLD
jgi:hypothetical protein